MSKIGKWWSGLCSACSSLFHGKPAVGRDYAEVLAHTYFSKLELIKMRTGLEPNERDAAQAFRDAAHEVVQVLEDKLANWRPEAPAQFADTADVRPTSPSPPSPPQVAEVVIVEEPSLKGEDGKEGE